MAGFITRAQLARNVRVNPSTVSRAVKLLTLTEQIQQRLEDGSLSSTEALRWSDTPNSPAKKRRRITREGKVATKMGTVTIKGRRLMTDDVLIQALSEALEMVRQRQQVEPEQAKAGSIMLCVLIAF